MEGMVGACGEIGDIQGQLRKPAETGTGFYKMDKEHITMIREDLANNFYALAQTHSEENRKLLEEFNDDQLQFTMELEAYEWERTQLTNDQLNEAQTEHVLIRSQPNSQEIIKSGQLLLKKC